MTCRTNTWCGIVRFYVSIQTCGHPGSILREHLCFWADWNDTTCMYGHVGCMDRFGVIIRVSEQSGSILLETPYSRTHHALHTPGRIMHSILQDTCVAKARSPKFHHRTIMPASFALTLHRGQMPSDVSELRTFFSGSYHKDELNDRFFVCSCLPCGNEESHTTG